MSWAPPTRPNALALVTGTRRPVRLGRPGVELAWAADLGRSWRLATAFSTLDARYRDGFLTCRATPCAAPDVQVAAGNRMPGTARATAWAELAWQPVPAWRAGVEVRAAGRVMVDDADSDAAPAYAVAAASLKYGAAAGAWRVSGFGRIDNVFARRYAGSVIVDEGNGRFFEPAPGRTWVAGLSAARRF